ncbi:esterase-like activity of phytase family protein [Thioclava atlantica]|uniref:Phytase-like domain-containing protein n=1 Tax=Thioclava atlantica TaxID=1317124 RepID=A0A085U1M5_9RHOB|nr:esterase-like activity of phytase family protein [Thioclava atlantica]KFE36872.1 hypothetical protein DW2_01900 [Thioclava atlantica]
MRLNVLMSVLFLLPHAAGAGPLPAPELVGEIALPSGLSLGGIPFGAISGLSYDPKSGAFFALSEPDGDHGAPRVYRLAVSVKDGRFAGLDIAGEEDLPAPGQSGWAPGGSDGGGIAVDPREGAVFWSVEAADGSPALYVLPRGAAHPRALSLPPAFLPRGGRAHGTRAGQGFEGLTLNRDAHLLVGATGSALRQDGPEASFTAPSPIRLLITDSRSLKPVAQYLYLTDTIPARPATIGGRAANGLSALASLPDGRLVAVERAEAEGSGSNIRFYVVSTVGATNVNGQDRLDLAHDLPVQKDLWFALRPGMTGITADDLEGLAFGPVIDGKDTLLTVSDNHFARHRATRFKLFEIDRPDHTN